ncbi:MAG: hypothetical protein ACREF4_00660 [Gammaproteobacteria bacterium]
MTQKQQARYFLALFLHSTRGLPGAIKGWVKETFDEVEFEGARVKFREWAARSLENSKATSQSRLGITRRCLTWTAPRVSKWRGHYSAAPPPGTSKATSQQRLKIIWRWSTWTARLVRWWRGHYSAARSSARSRPTFQGRFVT